jgi:hypothetical protein
LDVLALLGVTLAVDLVDLAVDLGVDVESDGMELESEDGSSVIDRDDPAAEVDASADAWMIDAVVVSAFAPFLVKSLREKLTSLLLKLRFLRLLGGLWLHL